MEQERTGLGATQKMAPDWQTGRLDDFGGIADIFGKNTTSIASLSTPAAADNAVTS